MLRELLRNLNPTQFWIVVAQSDPNHGEILEIAKTAGYESILVSTNQAVKDDQVQGEPTFIIKKDDENAVQKTLDEFARDGRNDEYEKNTAQHYVLHMGKSAPTEQVKGHIYSSLLDADDIEDEANRIRQEARSGIKAVRKEVLEHFETQGAPAPTFHALEDIGEFINGRKVLMLSGASKKSWPNISPEQQDHIKLMLGILARHLDPEKYVIVTGGTDHGVEKIAHDVFGSANFDILGTITENTGGNEVSTHVKHLVFTGINWFGMARPVYRHIVEAFNGENITMGGGEILRDMIQLALRLNLRMHNLNGPDGASTAAAKDYPAHAFSSVRELFIRMGLDTTQLPPLAKNPEPS